MINEKQISIAAEAINKSLALTGNERSAAHRTLTALGLRATPQLITAARSQASADRGEES